MIMQPELHRRWEKAQGAEAARAILRDAAHAMIRADGLAHFSMRSLASQVGASAMTAYRYYPDKNALVEDVRNDVWRTFVKALGDAGVDAHDPTAGFRLTCLAYLDFAVRSEQDFRLLFEHSGPARDATLADPTWRNDSWEWLLHSVGALDDETDPSEVERQAHCVWASLHGLAMLHLSQRLVFGQLLEDLAEPLITFLLAGLCRRPMAAAPATDCPLLPAAGRSDY